MPDTVPENRILDRQRCPFCHAVLLPGASRCWLCEAEVQRAAAHDAAAPLAASRAVPVERLGTYSLASLMMFVTLVAIILGISTISFGVGIPLGVMLLVAWWRTAAVSRRRATIGKSLTRSEQAHMYLSSFGLAIALLVMVAVGVGVALFSICFGFITVAGGMGGGPNDLVGQFVVCVVSFLAALGLILLAVKWDRYRWRRDAGENEEARRNREVP